MNVQFKKGVLELCVLALLARRDFYGYELVHRIAENIEIAEGTIYPLLRRLTQEGLFTTYLRESAEGPPRKYYRLTEKGREHAAGLKSEWLRFVGGVSRILEGDDANE